MHIRQTASYGRQADMAVSLINDYVKIGRHLSDIAILYRVKKEGLGACQYIRNDRYAILYKG